MGMYVIYVHRWAVFKTELAMVNKMKKLTICDKLNAWMKQKPI
jgi:hypothetical protein